MTSFSHHVPSRTQLEEHLGVGSNFGSQSAGGMVGEMYCGSSSELIRSLPLPTEADKPMIVELAVAAMEELTRLAQAGDPLWIHLPINSDPSSNTNANISTEILNEEEYFTTFPRGIGPTPLGLRSEASRESAVVIMNHVNLVEILMDVVIIHT